ncbi:hypothetical protein FHX48_000414 [Microbacterium halimionae]|uniref:Uncharacterized protein n=1 Tax=Microbacterium halimionae TaxID=1526413 RepID=A0A7W3JM37_9MICO|nr:hypothetical protein [Microbacterium halimionae]
MLPLSSLSAFYAGQLLYLILFPALVKLAFLR